MQYNQLNYVQQKIFQLFLKLHDNFPPELSQVSRHRAGKQPFAEEKRNK